VLTLLTVVVSTEGYLLQRDFMSSTVHVGKIEYRIIFNGCVSVYLIDSIVRKYCSLMRAYDRRFGVAQFM